MGTFLRRTTSTRHPVRRPPPPRLEALEDRLPPGDQMGAFLLSAAVADADLRTFGEGPQGATQDRGARAGTPRGGVGFRSAEVADPERGGPADRQKETAPGPGPVPAPPPSLLASSPSFLQADMGVMRNDPFFRLPAGPGGEGPAGPITGTVPARALALLAALVGSQGRPLGGSHDGGGLVQAQGVLPHPWLAQDVGNVGIPGETTESRNVYTVQGSGTDISGTADAFHFVYQPMTGDGELLARVTSVEKTNPLAKAGVMIRASLDADAANAALVLTAGSGALFQHRGEAGGKTQLTDPVAVAAPYWLKVVRTGDAVVGYHSPDGFAWELAGAAKVALGMTAFVGLAVTAHTDAALNTSTFDHVSAGVRRPFTWQLATPSPTPRAEGHSATVNGMLYTFGGFDNPDKLSPTARMDVFDPVTDSWTQLSDMPEATSHAGVAQDGSIIYMAGGMIDFFPGSTTTRVLAYDTTTDTWTDLPPLPEPLGAGGLVRVGRNLHFFSGFTNFNKEDSSAHYVFNLDAGGGWKPAAPFPEPRNHFGYAELNGLVYALGGMYGSTVNTDLVHVYDPATDIWAPAAPLPWPMSHTHTSTFVQDGRIVMVGGVGDGGILDTVLAYDPAVDAWVAQPSLPVPRLVPAARRIGDLLVVTVGEENPLDFRTETGTAVVANTWESAGPMPAALGEVAGGVVGNALVLVGQGSSTTFARDQATGIWGTVASRPFAGHHHAAEVVAGKFYLLGGLGASSEGKVQIHDPGTDTWSRGADMPFAAGSVASAVINGEIYVAGGIVGKTTTDQAAKYNPATDTWTPLAPMMQGRNHTAAATDGEHFWVFGGRIDGNMVSNGFDTVQVYDPAKDAWTSTESGSDVVPLPQARGGMGKAVFHQGEFYVFGGETLNGSGAMADNVYQRVDIYDPAANRWRLGPVLPTARHGIFPVLHAGRIYVAGGGVRAGGSSSALVEVYQPD